MTSFFKTGNTYWARNVASTYYFLLGLVFSDNKEDPNEIAVVELHSQWADPTIIKTSKEELLAQVRNGLKRFNQEMHTHYSVSKVNYPPSEDASHKINIYDSLTLQMVRRYHSNDEFDGEN